MRKAIANYTDSSVKPCGMRKERHRAYNSGTGCRECRQHSGSG